MAIKIFQNPPAPTAPTEPDFLQPHVSLISLSFERTLKAILLAAVPKKNARFVKMTLVALLLLKKWQRNTLPSFLMKKNG